MVCKFGSVTVVSEGVFVYYYTPTCLSYVNLLTIGTCVYTFWNVKICLGSGNCVLSDFVKYYLYGRLFLYFNT